MLRSYARPLTPYFSCVGPDITHRDVARVEEPGNKTRAKVGLLKASYACSNLSTSALGA